MTSRKICIQSGVAAMALVLAGCQHQPRVADLPPLPVPQAPQPTRVAVVQVPGPWGIYFDLDKAEILPAAIPILDEAYDAYTKIGRSEVIVDGHGDTTGGTHYNFEIGERRAEVVKAYLVDKGVPLDMIRTMTQGEHDLLVRTPDDVLERRNRRVEISFGPA